MVYSGAWGKLIHEKNQKQKISWHCPFKSYITSPDQTAALFTVDDIFQHTFVGFCFKMWESPRQTV